MLKKIIVGILIATIVGAGGAALAHQASENNELSVEISPLEDTQTQGQSQAQNHGQDNTQSGEPVVNAQETAGQPWQDVGVIIEFDDFGMRLSLQNGQEIYVELGPPEFWQAQEVQLQLGMQVMVIGTENEGMYHANQVLLADGQILQLRTDLGQPLWSGGATNEQGQNGGEGDGLQDPQVQVDEWITITGTLLAFQGGNMTVATPEGALITFQSGQPRFVAEQGVTFQVGDELILVGFYENDQFVVGDITQVSTGLRVILRDPNGRPLWGGPGSGGGGGNGNGNNGSGD